MKPPVQVGSRAGCESACDILPMAGPVLYFCWRPDPDNWQLLDASANLEAHLGYSLDDFLQGRASLRTITHPDDLGALEAGVRRHLQARETGWSQEYRFITRDGRVRWYRDWSHIRYDADGAARLAQTVALDITESRAAAEALAASERKYRLIVETAQEGVWIIDADGFTVFANASMATMLGCTVAEMTGKAIFDFTDEAGRRLAERNLQRRREGIGEQHEFRFVRKDGSDLWTLIETNPLRDEEGRYQGALAMVMDVSARRAAEEGRRALEARVQRIEKSESLGLMAGGIAHDFNNILAAIGGNIDLALTAVADSAPARRNLQAAQESVRRAAALCRHMLAYSGGGISDRKLTSVAQLLQDANLASTAGVTPAIRFSLQVAEGLPPVDVDVAQIRQALLNIVTNAVEAIGDAAGDIRVSASVRPYAPAELVTPWQDDGLIEGAYVCLEVADNGSGMSADTLHRIFDPFFSTRFTGRGLGLPSALGIVRSHRGAIQVESRLGQGTTVRVLLPAAHSATPAVARDTHAGQGAAGYGGVLVVDDEPAVREVAGQMLRRAGYVPMACACGRSALETLGRERAAIRCVLLDVTMPGMSGEDTLRELRKIDARLPVVVMSGYSRNDVATRFAGLAGLDFLEKPFSMRSLHDAVGRALAAASTA
jgi:two-component system cell cycle sensor histidine kinase/response regulator CckA